MIKLQQKIESFTAIRKTQAKRLIYMRYSNRHEQLEARDGHSIQTTTRLSLRTPKIEA